MRFLVPLLPCSPIFFFFNDTATTEIYTLSLHDALPIYAISQRHGVPISAIVPHLWSPEGLIGLRKELAILVSLVAATLTLSDRKSTRLNSSHLVISYAVFCLKKKKSISS